MADSIFAASSTTPPSSSERIASEFMAQGRPTNPATVSEGSVLGGLEIKTPKVGDGFIEWAINGYDLEGCAKNAPKGYDYDKHGDWLFDKTSVTVTDGSAHNTDQLYNQNYAKKG